MTSTTSSRNCCLPSRRSCPSRSPSGPSEGDLDLADRFLDKATEDAIWSDARLLASVYEERAKLRRLRDDPNGEAEEAFQAGLNWDIASDYERSRASYERVLELDPAHTASRFRLADDLWVLFGAAPEAEAQQELRRALEIITSTQRAAPVPRDLSWSYLTESYIRARLAGFVDAPSQDEYWRALLAAGRSLALDLDEAQRWVGFADAAYWLELFAVAEAVTAAAVDRRPDDETVSQHVRALINLGAYEKALTELGDPSGQFEHSMRAALLLRTGDPEGAIAVLRSNPPDPGWQWSRMTLIRALAITGRYDDAIAEAKDMDAALRDRQDELESLTSLSYVTLVAGDEQRALTLADRLRRPRTPRAGLSGGWCICSEATGRRQSRTCWSTWVVSRGTTSAAGPRLTSPSCERSWAAGG